MNNFKFATITKKNQTFLLYRSEALENINNPNELYFSKGLGIYVVDVKANVLYRTCELGNKTTSIRTIKVLLHN